MLAPTGDPPKPTLRQWWLMIVPSAALLSSPAVLPKVTVAARRQRLGSGQLDGGGQLGGGRGQLGNSVALAAAAA